MPIRRSRFCLNRIIQAQFGDEHRVLIGPKDVMYNETQISVLEGQGYTGFFPLEPFSPCLQKMSIQALTEALNESLDLIQSLA